MGHQSHMEVTLAHTFGVILLVLLLVGLTDSDVSAIMVLLCRALHLWVMTTTVKALLLLFLVVHCILMIPYAWDVHGQQCSSNEPPCCTSPNLPWFTKTLNATTNEDIEL